MPFWNLTLAKILKELHFSAQNVTKKHKSEKLLTKNCIYCLKKIERLQKKTIKKYTIAHSNAELF